MDLLTVTTNELERFPIRGVAAVCLRAAMRVRSAMHSNCDEDLDVANRVLQGTERCDVLYDRAESLYRLASIAVAEYRSTRRDEFRRLALAGAIIHSAVDCIADLDHDHQAALTNGMLSLRSCGKFNDELLSLAITRDLRHAEYRLHKEPGQSDLLQKFGPLWIDQPPEWYRES
ncbi:MAG: hypothetical protein R3C01_09780 [Planctomycetaceae bacterium]